MSNKALLYSGSMGGKSTFVGGLYSHLRSREDILVSNRCRIRPDYFVDDIIAPLFEQHQYPNQTADPYIIDFIIEGESFVQSSNELTFLDMPGEMIEIAQRPWEQQQNEDAVRDQYRALNLDEENNMPQTPGEINTLLTHEYFQSENLVFLLHMQKLLVQDQPLSFDADDLRKVTKEKDVAVVATGTDTLGHKPDEDVVRSGGILDYIWRSGNPVDTELLETIDDVTAPSQLTNILNTIKMEDDVSFFGVAVPSREPGEDDRPVVTENGTVETWGYENVINLLF